MQLTPEVYLVESVQCRPPAQVCARAGVKIIRANQAQGLRLEKACITYRYMPMPSVSHLGDALSSGLVA